jgi:hypothetical protein
MLTDYDAALVVRGFDGFQQNERYQMINFGYRYVARKFPWSWEQNFQRYTVNPGGFKITLANASDVGTDNVERVVLQTDPYRRQLSPVTEDYFFRNYYPLDLSIAQNRGISDHYIVWNGDLYFLKPPSVQLVFNVTFKEFLVDMTTPDSTPALPQIMDELILNAALVRCHERSKELTLAQEMQARVDEAIADMLMSDAFAMDELQERVLPDDQWL